MSNLPTDLALDSIKQYPKYSSYKSSGVEWLGDVPAHWEVRRLKFVAEIVNSKLYPKPEHLAYVGLENIESKTGNLVFDEIIDEIESSVLFFVKGDILFSKLRPYLEKVAIADFNGVCTTELLVLRPGARLHNHMWISRATASDSGAMRALHSSAATVCLIL